jgi:hypothetical protein
VDCQVVAVAADDAAAEAEPSSQTETQDNGEQNHNSGATEDKFSESFHSCSTSASGTASHQGQGMKSNRCTSNRTPYIYPSGQVHYPQLPSLRAATKKLFPPAGGYNMCL